ncbi:MAG: 16S rRNA (cytosine(1402)-N(4))-methyltransferase RsmH [Andreesenia angusta]|nr:16S rRNA (cytosine(1402)-N(4))-methyltransferase RsmH [Andreesenia angusta]
MNFKHISVMLEECIDGLNIKPDGIYVDGTMGGAGHSLEIVKKLDNGILVGIDQDRAAIEKATNVLRDYDDKVYIVRNNFKNIRNILFDLNIEGIDGFLLDLGVSSHQLDTDDRGFSYKKDSKLDMRMDKNNPLTAWHIVNNYSKDDLFKIIKDYGEERWAKRIAEFIIRERAKNRIDTTTDLVKVIKMAIPAAKRREGPHPARRTFQALRIEVNNELGIIEDSIKDAVKCMKKGGRICIISFHSLEDRIVKETFKELNSDCICPKEIPICVCDKRREIKIINKKPIIPSDEEIAVNPRSRSAKLRIAERI